MRLSMGSLGVSQGAIMKYRFIAVAAIVLLSASMASADSLDVVKGDTSWQSFQTPSTSGGTAFWNNCEPTTTTASATSVTG